ncbi:hypothetical protein BC827DRAFT_954734 [Russula dissimulans]|nr:hypothetical protein BC827DRAFT_954734 [Russula dissimulans]
MHKRRRVASLMVRGRPRPKHRSTRWRHSHWLVVVLGCGLTRPDDVFWLCKGMRIKSQRRRWSLIITSYLPTETMSSNQQQQQQQQQQRQQQQQQQQRQQQHQYHQQQQQQQTSFVQTGQSHSHTQPTSLQGERLWDALNQRVGNQHATPIDQQLVSQAVGQIPGVVPAASTTQRSQQYQTAQGTGGQYGQPTTPQWPQGSNAVAPRPQTTNAVQPQQAGGYQRVHFRSPITPRPQEGNTFNGGGAMGYGGPSSSSYVPGTGTGQTGAGVFRVNPFQFQNQNQNPQTGSGQPNSDPNTGRRSQRRG